MVTRGNTITDPESTIAVFFYWLCGSRRISLNTPHQTGTFCGRCTLRTVTCCFTCFRRTGSQWRVLAPGRGVGRVGTGSGDQTCRIHSSLCTPTQESGGFVSSWKRWSESEYTKGLRHQAPGHEFELKTPPDHSLIPERHVTTRETDLFATRLYYSLLTSASGGRDTTITTVDEDMTPDVTRDTQH